MDLLDQSLLLENIFNNLLLWMHLVFLYQHSLQKYLFISVVQTEKDEMLQIVLRQVSLHEIFDSYLC
jgi:hypothetical protein